jgi:hypothetical protein
MTSNEATSKDDNYWNRPGEQGYTQAMYRSSDVESYVCGRLWRIAIEIADALGVPPKGHVLDPVSGDGAFANHMLAARYRAIDGIDKCEAAIHRARAQSQDHATYRAVNLVTLNYDSLPRYDAAFLIRILHHVKRATPDTIRALARRTTQMIAPEPNGNDLGHKALEFTPSYRDAGEDSVRMKELMAVFDAAGWRTVICRWLNLFPNFTPGCIYRRLTPIEPRIETSRVLNALCTVDLYGLTLTC